MRSRSDVRVSILVWALLLLLLSAGCCTEPGIPASFPATGDVEHSLPPLPELPLVPVCPDSPAGYFEDGELESAVRRICGCETGLLTQKDLDRVERLVINGTEIQSLQGLQHCTHLRELQLLQCGLTDIAPLQYLDQLEILYLTGNPGIDISPLQILTGLKTLELSGCGLGDLSPLQDLTQLEELTLDSNELRDLSPLQKLTELRMLHVVNTPLEQEAIEAVDWLPPGTLVLLEPEK